MNQQACLMRRRVGRRWLLHRLGVGSASLVAGALAGCATRRVSSPAVTRQAVVRCLAPAGVGDLLGALAAAFQRERVDVQVALELAADEPGLTVGLAERLALNPPDLVWVRDRPQGRGLAAHGLLRPLDGLAAAEGWGEVLPPAALAAFAAPLEETGAGILESIWATPVQQEWAGLLYLNRAAFAYAGESAPADGEAFASVEDLAAAGAALATRRMGAIALAGSEPAALAALHDALLLGALPSGRQTAPAAPAAWQTASATLLDWHRRGLLVPGWELLGAAGARAMLADGRAALLQETTLALRQALASEAPLVDLGVCRYPALGGDAPGPLFATRGGLALPAQARAPEIAEEFLAFALRPAGQSALAAARAGLPLLAEIALDPAAGWPRPLPALWARLREVPPALPWSARAPAALVQRRDGLLREMLAGRRSPESIATELGIEPTPGLQAARSSGGVGRAGGSGLVLLGVGLAQAGA